MRQNFVAQFIQLVKYQVLLWRKTGLFVLASSGLQCCTFQCISVIDLLSTHLGCKEFFQDSESCSGLHRDHNFLVQVWLWALLWSFLVQPSSWSLRLLCIIPFSLSITVRWRNGSVLHRVREQFKMTVLTFHHLSSLSQMQDGHWIDHIEFCGSFSCSQL